MACRAPALALDETTTFQRTRVVYSNGASHLSVRTRYPPYSLHGLPSVVDGLGTLS